MSTDDGKRVAQEWADAMRRLREERDEAVQHLQTIVKQATKTEWECDIFTAELAWEHIENARIALSRIAR